MGALVYFSREHGMHQKVPLPVDRLCCRTLLQRCSIVVFIFRSTKSFCAPCNYDEGAPPELGHAQLQPLAP